MWRVRIDASDARSVADQLECAGFDVLEGSVGDFSLELVVTAQDLIELRTLGYAPVTLEESRPFNEIQIERAGLADPPPPGYPNLAQVIDEMNAAESTFPAICRMVDLTVEYNVPPTFEGRHVFAVKISDNVGEEEDEPVFLVVSTHHVREIVTPVIALYAIEQLTTLYGSDPQITDLVDSHEIWIAPVWNPDGYVYVFEVNNMWRKNRRVFPTGIGVDLNRNYPFGWHSHCSGSSSPSSITYKGPEPASESETKTMIAMSEDVHFTKLVDYHSSGREVLWGYACHNHPFETFLRSEAIALSIASSYGGSQRSPSAEGEHFEWQLAMHANHAFLIETHTTFQPPYPSAVEEAARVWPGVIWLLERAIPLQGHVTNAVSGEPVEALIAYQGVVFENGEENPSDGSFGRYHAFLPAGDFTVEFAAEGFVPQSHPVVITQNTTQVLDIQLEPFGCSGKEVIKAKCKSRHGVNKVKAKLKKGNPEASVTFRLDGDPQTDIVKRVGANGKAKVKYIDVASGLHTVEIVECGVSKNTVCP